MLVESKHMFKSPPPEIHNNSSNRKSVSIGELIEEARERAGYPSQVIAASKSRDIIKDHQLDPEKYQDFSSQWLSRLEADRTGHVVDRAKKQMLRTLEHMIKIDLDAGHYGKAMQNHDIIKPTESAPTTPIYSSLFNAVVSEAENLIPIGLHHRNLGLNTVIGKISENDSQELANNHNFPADEITLGTHIRIHLDIPEFEAVAPVYVDPKTKTALIAASMIEGRTFVVRPYGNLPPYQSDARAWKYAGDVGGVEWLRAKD